MKRPRQKTIFVDEVVAATLKQIAASKGWTINNAIRSMLKMEIKPIGRGRPVKVKKELPPEAFSKTELLHSVVGIPAPEPPPATPESLPPIEELDQPGYIPQRPYVPPPGI